MGVGIGRTARDKAAADIVTGVYPKFALGGRIIRRLVKRAMADEEIWPGGFEAPRERGDKGGDRVSSFDGLDEGGHRLSIGWFAGFDAHRRGCYTVYVGW